jgi:dUTP pyrophosphatase
MTELTITPFEQYVNAIKSNTAHDIIMKLSIYVDNDDNLNNMYLDAAIKHNNKIISEPQFYDAGFDMYLPEKEDTSFGNGTTFFCADWANHQHVNKVNFKIKCSAQMYAIDTGKQFYTGYYIHPRSSLSKTHLRLANSTGIIDAGYRGQLIGMFDCINTGSRVETPFDWIEKPYTRLTQICAPSLVPIFVEVVDTFEELGPSTIRGEGGIGSTGV